MCSLYGPINELDENDDRLGPNSNRKVKHKKRFKSQSDRMRSSYDISFRGLFGWFFLDFASTLVFANSESRFACCFIWMLVCVVYRLPVELCVLRRDHHSCSSTSDAEIYWHLGLLINYYWHVTGYVWCWSARSGGSHRCTLYISIDLYLSHADSS